MADERDDAALVAIEAALEGYPNPRFRERLRRSLREAAGRQARSERSMHMTTSVAASTVIPYLMIQDIEPVIAFAKAAFGATEVDRSIGSAGGIHCELRIGDSRLFFGGATPNAPVTPRQMGFHLFVPDVDAVYERAIEAGGVSLGEPAERPYGERSGFVKDPGGNHWYIATRTGPSYFVREPRMVVPHLYIQRTAERGAADFLVFVQEAFGAEIDLRHDEGGRVMHAVVSIRGDAVELGEGDSPAFEGPSALVVNVDDLDATYERALAAGATSLFPPAKQAFGGRMSGVADPWGNEWFLASA